MGIFTRTKTDSQRLFESISDGDYVLADEIMRDMLIKKAKDIWAQDGLILWFKNDIEWEEINEL